MDIVSTFSAGAGSAGGIFVFDSLIAGRAFTLAVVQSPDAGQHVDEHGQRTLDFLGQQNQGQQGQVHLFQVASASRVPQRMADLVKEAAGGSRLKPGDCIVLFGPDDATCQALVDSIGFKGRGFARLQ